MALPNDYAGQACSLARSLEIIGERWTLLIVRDAFWGVRRFADFIDHLGMPRAVLASRLKALIAAGVRGTTSAPRAARGGCSSMPLTAGRSTGQGGATPAAGQYPPRTPSSHPVPGSSPRRT